MTLRRIVGCRVDSSITDLIGSDGMIGKSSTYNTISIR